MKTQKTTGRQAGFTCFDWAILVAAVVLAIFLIPNFLPAARCNSPNACIPNLKQLDGAKATWALEHKKLNTDTPTEADLIGTNRYIRDKLVCPQGGKYTLGKVSEKPKCSIPAHVLP